MSNFNFQSIIIVTYGRSGSTLLQGLLNAISQVLIRGENQNYFYHIYKSHKFLKQSRDIHKENSSKPTQPWFGINAWDENQILSYYREISKSLILGSEINNIKSSIKCYGFKEIRFFNIPKEDFKDYLDFLAKIFPNPCFIFNFRNLDNVVKSEWWRLQDSVDLKKKMIAFENECKAYSINKPNCKLVTYENICLNEGLIEEIYNFIGAKVDKELIKKVLSTRHSYTTKNKKK